MLNIEKIGIEEFKKLSIEEQAKLFAEDVINNSRELRKEEQKRTGKEEKYQYCFMASLTDFNGKLTPHGEMAASLPHFLCMLPYPMPEKPNCCAWYTGRLTKKDIRNAYVSVMSKYQRSN